MEKRSASRFSDRTCRRRFIHFLFLTENCCYNPCAGSDFMEGLSCGSDYGTLTSSLFLECQPINHRLRSFAIGWNMVG